MDILKEADGYNLICDEREEGLTLTGYEGDAPVLDMSTIAYDTGDARITAIERKTFLCCNSLRKVILPSGIEHIGDWAFSKCENLSTVYIGQPPDGGIFGRGVFEGCERLGRIEFAGAGEGLSILLAAAVTRLHAEHLLRADDIGHDFWYEKWDISLLSLLNTDNTVNSQGVALGGEEDISYDGVASVDGEMPGVGSDHVSAIAKNKCLLCYLRLRHDAHLSHDTRAKIEAYIIDRGFGTREDWAWLTLIEDCADDADTIRTYLSVVQPDKGTIMSMINALDRSKVQLRAILINESEADRSYGLDDLFIY